MTEAPALGTERPNGSPRRDSGWARGGPRPEIRQRRQTPLDRYLAHNEIDERLWRAGERFRQIAHHAALATAVTARFGIERTDGGGDGWFGGMAPNDRAATARVALRTALTAIGAVLAPVVIDVLIADRPAGVWSRSRGRPAAHGLPTLIAGLESLALHFGVE